MKTRSKAKSQLTDNSTDDQAAGENKGILKRRTSKMPSNGRRRDKEQNQWVVLAPDKAIQGKESTEDPVFVTLLHPKTEKCAMFMLSSDAKLLYEVTSFKEHFRSWLINQTVQHDGSLKMVTPVDPLFLIMPYLRKSEKQMSKFMTLDQIVVDDNYPQCHRLQECSGLSNIENCCDIKGDDDLKVFRFNHKKTLNWLKAKVERTSEALEKADVHCSAGSQSSTFVRSSKGNETSKDDYIRYAAGMISDYLHPDLSKELIQFMGITEPEKKVPAANGDATEPPAKVSVKQKEVISTPGCKSVKQKITKTSSSSEPEEDYSKYFSQKKEKAKTTKMTAGQKALSKVDKTGMKSISSFFGKAAKKK